MGEVFLYKQGIQVPVEQQYSQKLPGLIRFIRISDIVSSNEPPRFINYHGTNLIKPDDLFMVRYGNPGMISMGYSGVIANNLFRLIPKKNIYTLFFYFLLIFENKRLNLLVSNTTMPALSFKALDTFYVNFPEKLSEQKVIGSLLKKLDSLITLQQRKLELLKEIKKGLLQKMFADKSKFPILRFEGFHAEWEQRKLGDIIKVSGGVPFKPSDYISNGLATIPKSSVNESGKANLRDAKQVSIKFKSKQNSLVYNGDIITSLRDLVPTAPNLGRVVQIDGTRTVYILSQGVYSLKANSNYVTKQFMVEYSNTPRYRNEIYKIKNGSTQVHIRSGQYLNIAISIPNISEQVKVSKLLKIINISITLQQRRLTKLNSIKKSLLQQMFI